MSKKVIACSSLWTGTLVGLYTLLYLVTPLGIAGVLPCTFVALPIFLAGGGKRENLPGALGSAIAGVAWGAIFLSFQQWIALRGVEPTQAAALSVAIATALLCAVHSLFTIKGLMSNIPMMFGAVACTFFVGLDKWPYTLLTLGFGIVLGYAISFSGSLIQQKMLKA